MNSAPIQLVKIDDIRVPRRLQATDADWVAALAASIKEQGLTSLLIVRPVREVTKAGRWGKIVPGKFDLIAGAHRLKAALAVGLSGDSTKVVHPQSPDTARPIEIDENLFRHELRPLGRTVFLAERKRVYERLHPETMNGAQGGLRDKRNENEIFSFSKATADRLGMSKRTVKLSIGIAQRVAPEVRTQLTRHRLLEKQTELLALADLPTHQQAKVVDVVLNGKASRVSDALAVVHGRSAKPVENRERQIRKPMEIRRRASKPVQRRFIQQIMDEGFSDSTDGVLAWVLVWRTTTDDHLERWHVISARCRRAHPDNLGRGCRRLENRRYPHPWNSRCLVSDLSAVVPTLSP